jgi:signal recognition particle subunit SEC65
MKTLTGNDDLDREILLHLSIDDIEKFCGSNQYTHHLCQKLRYDKLFWQKKMINDDLYILPDLKNIDMMKLYKSSIISDNEIEELNNNNRVYKKLTMIPNFTVTNMIEILKLLNIDKIKSLSAKNPDVIIPSINMYWDKHYYIKIMFENNLVIIIKMSEKEIKLLFTYIDYFKLDKNLSTNEFYRW